ncbi:hypothetical protein [Rhodoferax ferrireducens]|uniref:hypothetical protein n=1 Tax=Rhodoferax ferrireducens TaxID=192843 RepID=UPI0013004B12|nr:hypothetical protein [Rhodoferax ferrireducens]
MDSSLQLFIRQFAGVVLATLVPVILIAFMSIPVTLGGHPGEASAANAPFTQHMT